MLQEIYVKDSQNQQSLRQQQTVESLLIKKKQRSPRSKKWKVVAAGAIQIAEAIKFMSQDVEAKMKSKHFRTHNGITAQILKQRNIVELH